MVRCKIRQNSPRQLDAVFYLNNQCGYFPNTDESVRYSDARHDVFGRDVYDSVFKNDTMKDCNFFLTFDSVSIVDLEEVNFSWGGC